jgi:hypothetical protein
MKTHRSQARAVAFAQWQHSQRRDASPIDHTDEIEMLERALDEPWPYTPAGVHVMRTRLLILKAQASLLPLPAAAE